MHHDLCPKSHNIYADCYCDRITTEAELDSVKRVLDVEVLDHGGKSPAEKVLVLLTELKKRDHEIDILKEDLAHVDRRLKYALDQLRCPDCKCADQADAEAQECGCGSPICERDQTVPLAVDWLKLYKENAEMIEQLDLERDEFQRIQNAPDATNEIMTLAWRGQQRIKQKVPVLVQRDRAVETASKLRAALDAAETALDKIAHHPFTNYEAATGDFYAGQYGIGVVDGHRAASMIASAALAQIREAKMEGE